MSVKQDVLAIFEASRGRALSGEDLAARLHVSRNAVWKAVQTLRAEGYSITAVPNLGYCFSEETDILSAQSIARQMIDDAKAQAEEATRLAQTQAEETVLAAEKKAELILSGAKSRKDASDAEVTQVQEYALRCVENCVDKLRQQHKDAIELINAQWQDFLSGLILPEDRQPTPAESEPADPTLQPEQPVDWMAVANMDFSDIEQQYADIDADTFFSGNFFNEQSGSNILSELKAMMDSIEHPTEE